MSEVLKEHSNDSWNHTEILSVWDGVFTAKIHSETWKVQNVTVHSVSDLFRRAAELNKQ